MSKWYNNRPGPTDRGNKVGSWPGGWLNGDWKCPKCETTYGRNLLGHMPWSCVEKHKKECNGLLKGTTRG